MTKPLLYGDEVAPELQTAARWYEQQRQGLAQDFLAEVERTLQEIQDNPLGSSFAPHVPQRLKVRRRLVARFPYTVFYLDLPDHIRVIAIGHGHRRPGYWRPRLKK